MILTIIHDKIRLNLKDFLKDDRDETTFATEIIFDLRAREKQIVKPVHLGLSYMRRERIQKIAANHEVRNIRQGAFPTISLSAP